MARSSLAVALLALLLVGAVSAKGLQKKTLVRAIAPQTTCPTSI